MKKILITLLLALFLLFILDKIVYTTINFFYKKTYVGQDGGEINRYLTDKNPPLLAIMGSSTARFQVNPDSFQLRACNLGHQATTDCFQLALLHLMIEKKQVPKIILLSITPDNYIFTSNSETPAIDILYLKYYYDQSAFVKENIDKISNNERIKFLANSYKFNGSVLNIMRYYILSRNVTDFTPYYFRYQQSTPGDSLKVVKILMSKNIQKDQTIALSTLKTSYLPEIIKLCKSQNIKLMAYYMPMLSDDTIHIKLGLNFADSVLKVNNIPYFTFTQKNAHYILNNYNLWSDWQHLNEKGGRIQSKMLSDFVQSELKKTENITFEIIQNNY